MNAPLIVDIAFGGLLLGGLYAIISIGLNLQYGVAKILNLSHGEFIMICGLLTYSLYVALGVSPILSIFLVGIIVFIVGMAVYKLVFQRIINRSKSIGALEGNSILLSFGLLFVLQNIAYLFWGRDYKSYSFLAESLNIWGAIYSMNRVFTFCVAIVLSVILFILLRYTRFGLAIRCISSERIGAQLVGINVNRFYAISFGLGALMAGIAGVLISMMFAMDPTVGTPFTMKALIVLILGGSGNFLGSLIGGLMLGVAESLTATLLDPGLMMVVNYLIFIIVLLIRPKGIFTKRG